MPRPRATPAQTAKVASPRNSRVAAARTPAGVAGGAAKSRAARDAGLSAPRHRPTSDEAAGHPLPHADARLVRAIRDGLRTQADPVRAAGQQAYMKSSMPYLGVTLPGVRAICAPILAAHRLPTVEAWRDTALTLWREAAFREERYAVMMLTDRPIYAAFQTVSVLPLYRELIVTGAWWDYVDEIASRQIGTLLRRWPGPMARTLRRWAQGEDMWLRRTAILAQLTFKDETDLRLLYDCIEPSMDSREFFLRKAIGWALRQHARTDAAEVLRYVTAHRTRLSPLSKREALKAQLRAGTLRAVP